MDAVRILMWLIWIRAESVLIFFFSVTFHEIIFMTFSNMFCSKIVAVFFGTRNMKYFLILEKLIKWNVCEIFFKDKRGQGQWIITLCIFLWIMWTSEDYASFEPCSKKFKKVIDQFVVNLILTTFLYAPNLVDNVHHCLSDHCPQ